MAMLKLRFLVWTLFFCAIGFCLFAPDAELAHRVKGRQS